MASESRQLPKSNIKRLAAYVAAEAKNQELIDGGGTFLSTDTSDALMTNAPIYQTAMNDVANKEAATMNAVNTANASGEFLKSQCSRFIQVFKLAVEAGEFPVSDFLVYHLDSSGNVPVMNTNAEIKKVAANLISGEAARVALGQTAMLMPPIAKIISLNSPFLVFLTAVSTANSAELAAQRTLNLLNPLGDETILFVWNEVETHFSNRANPAIRVQGRLWGINYVRVGSLKHITGKVTDSITGGEIADANISFENGNNDATSDATGYQLDTTLMDVQNLLSTHPFYVPGTQPVTLVENEDQVVNVIMVKIV